MYRILFLFGTLLVVGVVCPPVDKRPAEVESEPSTDKEEENLGLEYERYMREVVKLLESDEWFRKQLESANSSEIKNGKIAEQLKFVERGIRSKLDELKRTELERLRRIYRMQERNRGHGGQVSDVELLGHLDPSTHSFEIQDLAKLINKTSVDLQRIDEQRKAEFKRYEMEKEHQRRMQLQGMDEEERKRAEQQHQQMEQKHKNHPKLNHPGNEEQLKEVWEESDGLEKDSFDPKTFFHLHDTNGDGMLDIEELEALFQLELDKVYNSSASEDDMAERYEEMNRMREHVIKEFDTNKDMMVSLDEFITATKKEEFKEHEDWQTLDNQTLYTEEEMKEYEQQQQMLEKAPVTVTPAAQQHQDQDLRFESEHHGQQQQHHEQQQQQQHHEQQQQHHDQQQQHHDQQQQQQHHEQQQQHHDQQQQQHHEQQQQQHHGQQQQQHHEQQQQQQHHEQQQQQQHHEQQQQQQHHDQQQHHEQQHQQPQQHGQQQQHQQQQQKSEHTAR